MATADDKSRQHTAVLLAITGLRSGADYRAAEITRRKIGAKQMVAKGPSSSEYASVRLLIGIWDNIAASARNDDPLLDRIFEHIPVCHMYEALREAVEMLREEFGDEYAVDFEWLYQQYLLWLERHGKGPEYRAMICGGLHAMFG
ncbi:MAG TPA: hypothetical protein VGL09_20940 [Methylomirabilota bacterium]|jgi:hypothetical protein